MDNSKRPFGASKTLNRSILKKMEDVAATLSLTRAGNETATANGVSLNMQFPIVQHEDLPIMLPKYTSILSRTQADGVTMADLDQLQLELEKLLSSCALRQRALQSDVDSWDRVDEKKERRGKSHEKPSSVKKRKVEKSRHKNARNNLRGLKMKHSLPQASTTSNLHMDPVEMQPLTVKHETSDRFWLFVDSYCQDVTKDNLVFLDDLIKECSHEMDLKIPSLGEHYASEWSEQGIQDEISNGCIMVDSLLEEKTMTSILFNRVLDKFKTADYIKGVHGLRNGFCLEKRLQKEGVLDIIDFSKSVSREDEILQEIKKCQEELKTVNQHNVTELSKLREVVCKDLKKQQIKAALDKVDRDLLNISQQVFLAKNKEEDLTKFQQETNALIKQQVLLNAELQNFNNATLLE